MAEVDFSESDFDPDRPSYKLIPPGKAHLLIIDVDIEEPIVKFTSEIIAHENDKAVNQTIVDRCNLGGQWAHRCLKLAMACGVITSEEIKSAQADGSKTDIDFEAMYGKTYCASITNRKGKEGDRVYHNIGWDFCSPTSDEASGFPKNEVILRGNRGKKKKKKVVENKERDEIPF